MAWVDLSLMIKLLQNKGKRYKQYNLSHTKKITSLCCQDDPSHFRFRPHGFVVVVVHHLVELCEARKGRGPVSSEGSEVSATSLSYKFTS